MAKIVLPYQAVTSSDHICALKLFSSGRGFTIFDSIKRTFVLSQMRLQLCLLAVTLGTIWIGAFELSVPLILLLLSRFFCPNIRL